MSRGVARRGSGDGPILVMAGLVLFGCAYYFFLMPDQYSADPSLSLPLCHARLTVFISR